MIVSTGRKMYTQTQTHFARCLAGPCFQMASPPEWQCLGSFHPPGDSTQPGLNIWTTRNRRHIQNKVKKKRSRARQSEAKQRHVQTHTRMEGETRYVPKIDNQKSTIKIRQSKSGDRSSTIKSAIKIRQSENSTIRGRQSKLRPSNSDNRNQIKIKSSQTTERTRSKLISQSQSKSNQIMSNHTYILISTHREQKCNQAEGTKTSLHFRDKIKHFRAKTRSAMKINPFSSPHHHHNHQIDFRKSVFYFRDCAVFFLQSNWIYQLSSPLPMCVCVYVFGNFSSAEWIIADSNDRTYHF